MTIGERFDEVQKGFLDQRDYTTFCFDRLREEMRDEFGEVRATVGRLARRLDRQDLVLGEILSEVKAQRPR